MQGDLDKPMFQLLWYLNSAAHLQQGFCMSSADGSKQCSYGREYDGRPNECVKYIGSVKNKIAVKQLKQLSIDALKTKLEANALIAVIDATNEFRNHKNLDGRLDDAKNVFKPRRWHSFKGKHALVLLGWAITPTEIHVLVKNSWDMEWGIAGHSWIYVDQKDYLKILSEVYEIHFTSLITNM
ncbi:hypothetical protein M3Y98_00422600 [Aphelenchoides besseyi]|nr:hypothetical protein M3Y98_00422600 [Aphelenchoides besseyi]KAI6202151.1 hypothetical protein M3Y96_00918000 [Aphelenchoides besseyi]